MRRARGDNGPLEARFLIKGMLLSWDAILSVVALGLRMRLIGLVGFGVLSILAVEDLLAFWMGAGEVLGWTIRLQTCR